MTDTITNSLAVFFLIPTCAAPAAQVEVTYTFADEHLETVTCPLVRDGAVQRFHLKASVVPEGVKQIEVLPDFAAAKTGEDGYFVMPNGFLGTFRQKEGEHP